MQTSRFFYINSENRESGTSSDFNYYIETANLKADTAVVTSLCVPKSFYLINSVNCSFTLVENSVSYTVTIPVGNYNRKNLASVVGSAMSTAGHYTYVISYNAITIADTGKYIFTVSGNSGIQPQIIFTTEVYEQLGFKKNTTYTFSGNILNSYRPINLQIEQKLFLHTDLITNGSDNIIQDILVNSNSAFSNVTYENNNTSLANPIHALAPLIRFWLTDEDGKTVDLNDCDIQITLLLYQNDDSMIEALKYIVYAINKYTKSLSSRIPSEFLGIPEGSPIGQVGSQRDPTLSPIGQVGSQRDPTQDSQPIGAYGVQDSQPVQNSQPIQNSQPAQQVQPVQSGQGATEKKLIINKSYPKV